MSFRRFVDRCQQLTWLIDTGGEWYTPLRRLIAEPIHGFCDRERAIAQTILLNMLFRGIERDGRSDLAIPPEALRLFNRRAVSEAVACLMEDAAARSSKRAKRSLCSPGIADPRVALALNYLLNRSDDPHLSLGETAGQSRLSKWHFDRLLKSMTGAGFRDHLVAARMAKARKLLETSTLAVKEIAARVGYKHTSQFSRHFKSRFGVTATQYRLSNVR